MVNPHARASIPQSLWFELQLSENDYREKSIPVSCLNALIRKRNLTSKKRTVCPSYCYFKAIVFLLPIDKILNVLGVIGVAIKEELSCKSITSRLAIISGTSTCHMAVCYSNRQFPL